MCLVVWSQALQDAVMWIHDHGSCSRNKARALCGLFEYPMPLGPRDDASAVCYRAS